MKINVGNIWTHFGAIKTSLDKEKLKKIRKALRIKKDKRDGGFYFEDKLEKSDIADYDFKFLSGWVSIFQQEGYIDDKDKVIDTTSPNCFGEEITTEFEGAKLREDQAADLKRILEAQRGGISLATNYGKSYLILFIVLNANYKSNILITTPTEVLHKQVVELLRKFITEEPIGVITSKKLDLQRITIAMKKTLKNRSSSIMDLRVKLTNTDILIVDEAHQSAAESDTEMLSWLNCYHRFGMSGTLLDGNEENAKNIIGHFGNISAYADNEQMIQAGVSAKPKVVFHKIDYPPFIIEKTARYESKGRLKVMQSYVDETLRTDKIMIIFCKETTHAEFLYNNLEIEEQHVVYLHGKSRNKDTVKKNFNLGLIPVVITTIWRTGVNITNPDFTLIVNAMGGMSATETKQGILGRGLRKQGGKEEFTIVDFWDFTDKGIEAAEFRRDLYLENGCDVTYNYKNKNGFPLREKVVKEITDE